MAAVESAASHMAVEENDAWAGFVARLEALRTAIARLKTVNVNSASVRGTARECVDEYFRRARPALLTEGIGEAAFNEADALMQILLRLSHGLNARESYRKALREAHQQVVHLESLRAKAISNARHLLPGAPTIVEQRILETLNQLLPGAALSYRQASQDLVGPPRSSYRGTAVELRETLRELLDHLAPDEAVMRMPGYKPEGDRGKPTMRQKARFILRAREVGETSAKAPEDSVALVDELASTVVRSTYELGSVATHIRNQKGRVDQLKMYVDTVLAELLKLHRQRI
jgi:hypothetical protein